MKKMCDCEYFDVQLPRKDTIQRSSLHELSSWMVTASSSSFNDSGGCVNGDEKFHEIGCEAMVNNNSRLKSYRKEQCKEGSSYRKSSETSNSSSLWLSSRNGSIFDEKCDCNGDSYLLIRCCNGSVNCRCYNERTTGIGQKHNHRKNTVPKQPNQLWISGRNWCSRLFRLPSCIYLILLLTSLLRIAESCSSRSTPKPQQPSSTMRPNMTFHTYACPPKYAAWYCLNGATCFTVRIADSILYNCECADGYIGQRCEFKDLDKSYLPSRDQVMVETASIAGGVTVAVLLIVIIIISLTVYCRRRDKLQPIQMVEIKQEDLELKPFRSRPSFKNSIRMSTALYSTPNEPESGQKSLPPNTETEQPNSTSA